MVDHHHLLKMQVYTIRCNKHLQISHGNIKQAKGFVMLQQKHLQKSWLLDGIPIVQSLLTLPQRPGIEVMVEHICMLLAVVADRLCAIWTLVLHRQWCFGSSNWHQVCFLRPHWQLW